MDYPIIFIPGLFGSLGEDIIEGTGDFSFGFAEDIYRPFVEILNKMGYIEGKDLFISYYDWRKTVIESVNKYLLPDIEYVKRKTGSSKVILIGHSLGGLLAKSYVNFFHPSSVDKLIMLGTPNLGSVNAYYFWSGGELPYPKIEENILYNAVKMAFILYYKLFHNMDYIDAARDMFPVARDLLPSYGYGNYLIKEENGLREEIPTKNMSIENSFLNLMEKRTINRNNTFIISGDGVSTNNKFLVDTKDMQKNKWIDGRPIKEYKIFSGDGTVTTMSTLGGLGVNHKVLQADHTDILYKSKDYLSSILGKPIVSDIETKKPEKIYIVLAKECEKIEIKTSDNNKISRERIEIVDSRVKAINLNDNNFLIMAAGDRDLEIKLDVKGIKKSNPKMYKTVIQKRI